ncbi:MAG: FtsX-like permease family protein [Cyclobacteriaceae bacterium]|nr:FtsX-like permease family protein [Cyclobacteriaceae bacterium]
MIDYKIKLTRPVKNILNDAWVWKMAWRDARHNFSRLFLFLAALVTGIAAVVALDSFNQSVQDDIENNAKELLGADLVLNSNKSFDSEIFSVIDTTQVAVAGEVELTSMVLFKNSGQTRLIRLLALQGDFPFYGELKTLPEDAYQKVKQGNFVILDETLATQYEVSSGDSVKIGNIYLPVAGVVTKIPGGGGLSATFAPTVYMSVANIQATGLIQFGSRVNYSIYIKTKDEKEAITLQKNLESIAKRYSYGFETVQGRKDGLGAGFESVYRFFSLLAIVALLLGCIGVASAVHIYAKEKREEVAILRCLGSTGWQAFSIYFIQIALLGIIGSMIGATVGVLIQQSIPYFLSEYLPVDAAWTVSWSSIWLGIVLGFVVSVLFSLLPLVNIRFVPPLAVLRTNQDFINRFSKLRLTAWMLIVLFPLLFTWWQTKNIWIAFAFISALLVVFLLLSGLAWILLKLLKKFFPSRASFAFRLGVSSLFRPNNQTQLLLVSIGMGAFLIATLNVVEESMLAQVEFAGNENQANTILFDIQPEQKEGVIQLMKDHQLPVLQVVPIVTCRIQSLKNIDAEKLLADTTDSIPSWAINREYRVTYRDTLTKAEKMVKGKIQFFNDTTQIAHVTISEGMHENLKLDIGDSLVFNVQGVPIQTIISGIRKVEWSNDPPNFIFVFPAGVLEQAPQIFVNTTKVIDDAKANVFQRELVTSYPNVSLVDLRLILGTIRQLFDKLGLVVRFLALFSIITGLIVLAGAVINSKYARLKENVLLRTLGARAAFINKITLVEYFYLGCLAASTGVCLSLLSGYLLTQFFFKISFAFNGMELGIILMIIVFLTMLIGWINLRNLLSTPPLQVLRKEN